MKIKINETILASSKNIEEFKLMVASDFHFNNRFDLEILNRLGQIINDERPNCLIIPGDLLHSNTKTTSTLQYFLNKHSDLTKIIITLGDTDYKNKKEHLKINNNFFNSLEKNPNIKLFKDNNSKNYRVGNFMFLGCSPDLIWFERKDDSRIFEFEMINYLINNKVNEDKYNIFITHDATDILKKPLEYQKHILNKIDLVITGNQGFTPRNRYRDLGHTSLIISRGIKSLNQLYQPEVDIIKIKKLK